MKFFKRRQAKTVRRKLYTFFRRPIIKGIFERRIDLGAFRDTQPNTQPDAF
jgi:hypothetical protein